MLQKKQNMLRINVHKKDLHLAQFSMQLLASIECHALSQAINHYNRFFANHSE